MSTLQIMWFGVMMVMPACLAQTPCNLFTPITFAGNTYCRFGANVTSVNGTNDCISCTSGAGLCINGTCHCFRFTAGSICFSYDSCVQMGTPCDSVNGYCQPVLEGSVCACNPGWIFNADKTVCNDIDECTIEGFPPVCDEENGICTNTNGSYICGCKDGYTLGMDNSTCIVPPPPITVRLDTDDRVLRAGASYNATCNITAGAQTITWFIGATQITTGIATDTTDPGFSYSVLTFVPTANDHWSYLSCRSTSGAIQQLMLRVLNFCGNNNNVQTPIASPTPEPQTTPQQPSTPSSQPTTAPPQPPAPLAPG